MDAGEKLKLNKLELIRHFFICTVLISVIWYLSSVISEGYQPVQLMNSFYHVRYTASSTHSETMKVVQDLDNGNSHTPQELLESVQYLYGNSTCYNTYYKDVLTWGTIPLQARSEYNSHVQPNSELCDCLRLSYVNITMAARGITNPLNISEVYYTKFTTNDIATTLHEMRVCYEDYDGSVLFRSHDSMRYNILVFMMSCVITSTSYLVYVTPNSPTMSALYYFTLFLIVCLLHVVFTKLGLGFISYLNILYAMTVWGASALMSFLGKNKGNSDDMLRCSVIFYAALTCVLVSMHTRNNRDQTQVVANILLLMGITSSRCAAFANRSPSWPIDILTALYFTWCNYDFVPGECKS